MAGIRTRGSCNRQRTVFHISVSEGNEDRDTRRFFTQVGFRTCIEAVNVTRDNALFLLYAHDLAYRG